MQIKTKRILFYSISFLIILVLSAPFLISWGVNSSRFKNYIAAEIQKRTYNQIEISDFSVTLFPHPGLRINNVTYQPPPKKTPLIQIGSLYLLFNISELLNGSLLIDQVRIDRPKIDFTALSGPKDKAGPKVTELLGMISAEKIFRVLPKAQERLEIEFKYFSTPYFLNMNGRLYLFKKTSQILADITVENAYITPEDPAGKLLESAIVFKTILSERIKLVVSAHKGSGLKGRVTCTNTKVISRDNKTIFWAELIEPGFSINEKGIEVGINPFKLKKPDATVGFTFKTDLLFADSLIRFSGKNVNAAQAREMSLQLFQKNDTVDTLFDIIRAGHIPDITVTLQAEQLNRLIEEENLVLKGAVNKAVVHIPETGLVAKNVNGVAGVKNGILDLKISNGEVKGSHIKKGVLILDLLHFDDVPFNGNFYIDADLSAVPEILTDLLQGHLIADEMKRVTNVSGRCNAVLDLNYQSRAEQVLVKLDTDPFSVSGQYDRIFGPIELNRITFSYARDIVRLSGVDGHIAGNSFNDVNAVIDVTDDTRLNIISGTAQVDLGKLFPWLMSFERIKKIVSPLSGANGKLLFTDISLDGPVRTPEDWTFNIKGDADSLSLTTVPVEKQIEDLSFHFQILENGFFLNRMAGKFHSFGWLESTADHDAFDNIDIPVSFKNGIFRVLPQGRVEINGDLTFKENAYAKIMVEGASMDTVRLKQIHLIDPGQTNAELFFSDDSLRYQMDFKGRLNTLSMEKLLKKDGQWSKLITFLTDSNPVIIEALDDDAVSIQTPCLDLETILTEFKSSPETDKPLFPEKTIHLLADKVTYKNKQLNDISCNLLLSDKEMYLRLLKADLCSLSTRGYVNYKNKQILADFPFKATDQDNIQTLLSCLFNKDGLMDGQYTFEGDLSIKAPVEQSLENISGSFKFTATNGRIYKMTLLSRILTVLNVSQVFRGKFPDITQEGFAYKEVILEADVKKSVIHLNKAVIDGKDMTMIFSGTVDPVKDEINLTGLVAPLKTVDLIISHIPIVNTLLSGRLVSVPVKAGGSLSDPKVMPLHPSAVGKGLLNMMTDILKTPVRLLDKLSDEKTKPKPKE